LLLKADWPSCEFCAPRFGQALVAGKPGASSGGDEDDAELLAELEALEAEMLEEAPVRKAPMPPVAVEEPPSRHEKKAGRSKQMVGAS
jgi:hypothetical protein